MIAPRTLRGRVCNTRYRAFREGGTYYTLSRVPACSLPLLGGRARFVRFYGPRHFNLCFCRDDALRALSNAPCSALVKRELSPQSGQVDELPVRGAGHAHDQVPHREVLTMHRIQQKDVPILQRPTLDAGVAQSVGEAHSLGYLCVRQA